MNDGMTTDSRIACPSCGQDWVVRVRLVYLRREVMMCRECDSLWTSAADVGVTMPDDYATFMNRHGRQNAMHASELEVLGLATNRGESEIDSSSGDT